MEFPAMPFLGCFLQDEGVFGGREIVQINPCVTSDEDMDTLDFLNQFDLLRIALMAEQKDQVRLGSKSFDLILGCFDGVSNDQSFFLRDRKT